MANLYDIGAELERTLQELDRFCNDNDTDELPDELVDRLTINQDELTDKLSAYYHTIEKLKAEVTSLDAYRKSITDKVDARKKNITNTISNLSKIMIGAVNQFGEERKNGNKFYKLPFVNVNVTKSNKVKVVNGELVPICYIKTKTTTSLDKTAISKALKAGDSIAGVELEQNQNLSFK